MKQLIFWVVGGVVGTLLGSCAIGIAASEFGGREYVGAARDISTKADRTEHATGDYLGRFVVKPIGRTIGFASEVASVGHHVATRGRDAKRTATETLSSARTYISGNWRRISRRARIVIQTGVDGLHDLPTR